MERSAAIILAVSSLPSNYGIGTLGKSAYAFADFLKKAGQKYWQMLPLGPTSYGDSPYQCLSTFAGNPYYVDLDLLIEDGLLKPTDLQGIDWGASAENVNYGKIYENRFKVLKIAKENGWERDRSEVNTFLDENEHWVYDYALYMAAKRKFNMQSWMEWPDAKLRRRDPETMKRYREELKEDFEFFLYIQYLFYKQWKKLREYIKSIGLQIIGDIPFYVAMDSADVWAEPEFFLFDEDGNPKAVAGVPPDAFTADGQLWGNPLYDWKKMEEDGYGWWIRRIDGAGKLFDVIRFDHFRGLDAFWAVPYGEKTAKTGEWRNGPGMKLIGTLNGWFRDLKFIAEDLGILTDSVRELQKESGWPGMKVLQFAFSANEPSTYLPHNYDRNCVCYTGTHDNTTAAGWFTEADRADVEVAMKYLGLHPEEGYANGLIRGGMSSVADLFVAQMQDYLNQGSAYRMNTPGTFGNGNWTYRVKKEYLTDALAEKIYRTTKLYCRI